MHCTACKQVHLFILYSELVYVDALRPIYKWVDRHDMTQIGGAKEKWGGGRPLPDLKIPLIIYFKKKNN